MGLGHQIKQLKICRLRFEQNNSGQGPIPRHKKTNYIKWQSSLQLVKLAQSKDGQQQKVRV